MTDILDIISTVIELSSYDDNKKEEIEILKVTVGLIQDTLQHQNMDSGYIEISEDLHNMLQRQLKEASQLLTEIEAKSKKKLNPFSKFYEKVCAILPNNLLSKIKESNDKLFATYNKLSMYYSNVSTIRRTSSEGKNNKTLEVKIDEIIIPNTILQDEPMSTLIDPDGQEEETKVNHSKKIIVKLTLRGKQQIVQAFSDNKLNKEIEIKYNITSMEKDVKEVYKFERQPYQCVYQHSKIKDILNMHREHAVIIMDQKEGFQVPLCKKSIQKLNKNKQVDELATLVEPSETPEPSPRQNLNEERFSFFLKNLGQNGTYLYRSEQKNQDNQSVQEGVWTQYKMKDEQVKLVNGDCIGIIMDKISKELVLGFDFNYHII